MEKIGIFFHRLREHFLWFRKRFFPLRLTILLALLAVPLVERGCGPHPSGHPFSWMIQELVYIASESIRAASEPKVVHSQLVFNKAGECAKLKQILAPYRAQLPPGLLDKKPMDSDLQALYAEAARLKIEPYASQDYKTFRRKLFTDAQSETNRMLASSWAEVKEDIFHFYGWNLKDSFSFLIGIFYYMFPLYFIFQLGLAALAGYVLYYKKSRLIAWGLPLGIFLYFIIFPLHGLPPWVLMKTVSMMDVVFVYIPKPCMAAAMTMTGIRCREKGVSPGKFLGWLALLAGLLAVLVNLYPYSLWEVPFHSGRWTPYWILGGILLLLLPLVLREQAPFRENTEDAPNETMRKKD